MARANKPTPVTDRRHAPKPRAHPGRTDSSPRNLTTTNTCRTTTHSHPALQFRHRTEETTHHASSLSSCPLRQAPPQLKRTTSNPPDTNEEPHRGRSHSKSERGERCSFPTTLDSPRQVKPEVPAKPTRPQNTIKNCLSFTHKAEDHCACSLSHEQGEAHPAQSSQGASYRSYNEGQGRPFTRKTSLVNDAISLRLLSSCPIPVEPLPLEQSVCLTR